MTLKVRLLRCSRRLFIILASLRMTWFSEKMLISSWCIHGFMSNLIKKSWTDSSACVISHGCRLTLQTFQSKEKQEWWKVSSTYFWLFVCQNFASVCFCLFLANDSNEHSQLNTIKCDYNGQTLATVHSVVCKVEGILKGRLDLIPSPSPSVKIQIMGGKVCLRCKVHVYSEKATKFCKISTKYLSYVLLVN